MASSKRTRRAEQIRSFLLDSIRAGADDVVLRTSQRFDVSRQAVNKQLDKLEAAQLITAEGATSARKYKLRVVKQQRIFELGEIDEDEVWRIAVAPEVVDLSQNVQHICQHGVTEMVNNVIDHSGSPNLVIIVAQTIASVDISILDFGVGIFNKIRTELGLDTPQDAAFELHKGKLTTDPSRHSGEGIFFSSKMFDAFGIHSGELYFQHKRAENDWLLEGRADSKGTLIFMSIATDSTHTTEEVFNEYSVAPDSFNFDRTKVAIALAETDERLVSRSQAKRVLARLFRFKEAVLDFQGVETIGPAFADEVFRVYVSRQPNTTLTHVNANQAVERMIDKAIRDRAEAPSATE